jgi:hypothetical protein
VHCRHKSGTSQAQKTSIQITAARVHTNSQHRTCSVTSLLHVGSYTMRSSLSMQPPRRGQHNISTTSFSTRSTTTTSINATTASVRRMNQHRHQYDAIRNVPQTNNRRSRKESVRKRTPTRAGQCHHIPQHTARSRHHVTNGDSRMSTCRHFIQVVNSMQTDSSVSPKLLLSPKAAHSCTAMSSHRTQQLRQFPTLSYSSVLEQEQLHAH